MLTVRRLLKKLNIERPYDPAIPLLGVHPKELKARTWTDICIPMFITALFTGAKRRKQPKCPPTDRKNGKQNVVYAWYV